MSYSETKMPDTTRAERPGATAARSSAAMAAADIEAAKRVLYHIRSHLELLTSDVIELRTALDGEPGTASALAARLLDDPDDLLRYAGLKRH
jgi:hypothetical protein